MIVVGYSLPPESGVLRMVAVVVLLLSALLPAPEPSPAKSTKEALQPFQGLVGSWKSTGYPEGTREERAKGFWNETLAVEWTVKADDFRMVVAIEKGKHFASWDLHYLPAKSLYELTATTPTKDKLTYTGTLAVGKQKEQILTLDRTDEAAKEDQRVVITLLHSNRFLYRFETRPAKTTADYTRKYQVGATKEGEPFAEVNTGPVCIVSGGVAKTPVNYDGKVYYVCCSGCKRAFEDDPAKYVAEYKAKLKGK